MPQFEAAGAQVLGVSADHVATLDAFVKQNPLKHGFASDFRRTMLPGYGALVTDIERQMQWWTRNGFMKRTIPLKGIVDTSFVEEAAKAVPEK